MERDRGPSMTRYTVVYTSPPFISNARVCGNITGKNRIPPYTARRRPPSVRSVREGHQAANSKAANVILSDVAKYGGPESLAVRWARLVIERAQPTIKGPLFKAT